MAVREPLIERKTMVKENQQKPPHHILLYVEDDGYGDENWGQTF